MLILTDFEATDSGTLKRYYGNENPCVLCQRDVKINERTLYVHVVNGGCAIIPIDEIYDRPNADLGWLPVGSDCAKRLPTNYVKRLP